MQSGVAMRSFQTVLVVAALVLAGCTGKGDDLAVDDSSFDEFGLGAKAGLGVIRGVVIDDAIRPIAGVTLTIPVGTATQSVQSNDEGAFGFGDLEPGTYVITAEKPGYQTVQAQVQVVADVAKPPIQKIQLAADASTTPFAQLHVFSGFVECSVSTPAYRVAVCAFVPGAYSDDEFLKVHEIQKGAWTIQSEMAWESTQALGEEMLLVVERTAAAAGAGASDGGPSPLAVRVPEERMEPSGLRNSTTLQVRVFNYHLSATEPPVPVCGIPNPIHGGTMCAKGVGLTIQQDFTIYTHVSYNFFLEEGWRFSSDGDPVPPS